MVVCRTRISRVQCWRSLSWWRHLASACLIIMLGLHSWGSIWTQCLIPGYIVCRLQIVVRNRSWSRSDPGQNKILVRIKIGQKWSWSESGPGQNQILVILVRIISLSESNPGQNLILVRIRSWSESDPCYNQILVRIRFWSESYHCPSCQNHILVRTKSWSELDTGQNQIFVRIWSWSESDPF